MEALRDELRFELVVLHTEVKELNKGWDFTAIIKPLMDDEGPPILSSRRI